MAITRNIMYEPLVPLNAPLAGGAAADNVGEAAAQAAGAGSESNSVGGICLSKSRILLS